jgi:hypothetical protein
VWCRPPIGCKFRHRLQWNASYRAGGAQWWTGFLSELHALKVDLFLHQQGLDTTTPAGKAMFQMMGVFAEFERSMNSGTNPRRA